MAHFHPTAKAVGFLVRKIVKYPPSDPLVLAYEQLYLATLVLGEHDGMEKWPGKEASLDTRATPDRYTLAKIKAKG